MSDDQDGCEWVNVSSGTGLPGESRTKGPDKRPLNGCVCVCYDRWRTSDFFCCFDRTSTSYRRTQTIDTNTGPYFEFLTARLFGKNSASLSQTVAEMSLLIFNTADAAVLVVQKFEILSQSPC